MAMGVSDRLFWQVTIPELDALLSEIRDLREREYRANAHLAAMVACATYNVHRKKGKRPLRPQDLLKQPAKELTPEQINAQLYSWAMAIPGAKVVKA